MDPLSQAVVGATVSVLAAGRKRPVKAALVAGVVGGMLPDLDVLIRSNNDPLLHLQYHRHFTHSLAFIPLGGFIAGLLCWPLLRKLAGFWWVVCFATLGYATHGLLDASTNYGTHLLWPFDNSRTSWNLISIIDPIFTLTLLILLVVAWRKNSRRPALYGTLFGLLYLSAGFLQRERVEAALITLAETRGHVVEAMEVKPSFANNIVWRGQYRARDQFRIEQFYIEAFRAPPLGDVFHLRGTQIAALSEYERLALVPVASRQAQDIARFHFFSDGWLALLPENPQIIADMRFAMLPQSPVPLWGIRFYPEQPHLPVDFVSLRKSRKGSFVALWNLAYGDQTQ